MIALRLLGVLALVGINAFFAAAEFSLVAIRLSRVRQLVGQGNARARIVQELLADLDRVVSGVQVGITLSSLGLGALGEVTVARFVRPLFDWLPGKQAALIAHSLALTLAFLLLTVMHVVLGELVPKTISLQRAERVALLVARPFHWFLHTFRWAIDLLEGMAGRITHALGVAAPHSHTLVHSAEELQILIQQARERGLLARVEESFVQRAIEMGQLQVREIMVARPDMHLLEVNASLEEVLKVFATTQRSRIPVYEGIVDHILGFLHIKDMLWVLLDRERRSEEGQPAPDFHLRRLLREILIVPESKLASELLAELRASRIGMAMVVDEFGSILGLVTLEDVLEQLVGEIHDEFDVIERPLTLADGAMVFDASLNVRDLETQYDIVLPEDPAYATVGGFVLSQLGFIPRGGESFDYDGYRFTVLEMDQRRVARLKIQRIKAAEPPSTARTPATPQGSPSPGPKAG
ncbi:MAG TPA: hemolysin family protein [Candidatus Acidoferrales bacterium]|nr:hemolysin family protein [Candidatus Acidoferrales bacterium]